jgi:metal-responsive CopG/Arc/MetJ family transcriptional regulator
MKTAISLPDDVFEGAELLAKRLKMSRSELYARAVAEFISRYSPDEVTESFDKVCAEVGPERDPALRRAAQRVLERSEW